MVLRSVGMGGLILIELPRKTRKSPGMDSASWNRNQYVHLDLCCPTHTHTQKALFNVMLREFGVRGVKVQEIVSLDDELLAFLK